GAAKIENDFEICSDTASHMTTSHPTVVSARCVKCNRKEEDSIIVFQKASIFDSSMIKCQTCNHDSVDVTIKDCFSINELIDNFSGKEIPAKFIRYDIEGRTNIIELG